MNESYPRTAGARWGTYSRISEDPRDTQRGVARQQEDTRKVLEARGITVTTEYVENDTSAYRKRRVSRRDDEGNEYFVYRTVRPVWQQALSDLRAGTIDALMVWDLDRLARDPRDLEDAIEVVEHHGRIIESETGSIDLRTDSGRAMARVLMAMNNKSSADTGRRVSRAALESAKRGTPAGKRAFGWAKNKIDLDPRESALAREAVEHVIRGSKTLWGIANEWNEAGALTAFYETAWTNGKLRQYFRNPRLAGLRTYRGEILHDDNGEPVRGIWEPLLTVEKWQALQAALNPRPENRHRVPHKNARTYLLTGLLHCGICGGPMYGNRDSARDTFWYRCIGVRHGADKHTLTIGGPPTDEAVSAVATARLEQAEGVTLPQADFPRQADLVRLEDKIRELMKAFSSDEMPGSVVFPAVKDLEGELMKVRSQQSVWDAQASSPRIDELGKVFESSSEIGVRRTVLERLFEAVMIRPPVQGVRTFNPDRITYVWRQS